MAFIKVYFICNNLNIVLIPLGLLLNIEVFLGINAFDDVRYLDPFYYGLIFTGSFTIIIYLFLILLFVNVHLTLKKKERQGKEIIVSSIY
jgi:hypothetical protein